MRRPDSLPDRSLDRTTPVPNTLLDTFLPHLSDTELRVLLVVDRATLGWKEGAGRKKSDWLSHRQLQARTGRAGASVSHAVERLVRRGLLIVEDGSGQARDSAHSRRAARGRLFYRLGDVLLRPEANHSSTGPREEPETALLSVTYPGEVEAHTELGEKFELEERFERANAAPVEGAQEAVPSSSLRLQKLKTTKEKQDEMSSSESEVQPLYNGSAGGGSAAVKMLKAEDLEPQIERFVSVFTQTYRLARPDEAVPPVEAADRELLGRFLRQPGAAVLEAWLPTFFASSFGYARRRGWSLGCYLNCFFILQAQAGTAPLRKGN